MVALDVVTAEGKKLHCDKEHNRDLFWAARGAGPGFTPERSFIEYFAKFYLGFPAIVTAFYLNVRPSFSAMKSSTFMWPTSEYKTVMDWILKVRMY
jgi:hypothetical protein